MDPNRQQTQLISPGARWVLMVGFALICLIPPIWQAVAELAESKPLTALTIPQDGMVTERLRKYETALEENSKAEELFLAGYSQLVYNVFHEGNHKVYRGKGTVLHYRDDLASITGRNPMLPAPKSVAKAPPTREWTSSLDAILDFSTQLHDRNIQLLLVPVPSKVSVYPETMGLKTTSPLVNPQQEVLYGKLREAGVEVLDLTPAFWNVRSKEPLYLEGDSHWTPAGMEVAAQLIATTVKSYTDFPALQAASKPIISESRDVKVTNVGDLTAMLGLSPATYINHRETAAMRELRDSAGKTPLERDIESPVVLLGDSFANIYSVENDTFRWGSSAGLPQHLMALLGMRLDVITGNGGGATASRVKLVQLHGSLERKKLVIWVLAARLLMLDEDGIGRSIEGWEKVKIPQTGKGMVGEQTASENATSAVPTTASSTLPAGAVARVRARVTAVPAIPDIRESTYVDYLLQVNYQVESVMEGNLTRKDILVVHWVYRNRVRTTDLPSVGDVLELTLAESVPNEFAEIGQGTAETIMNDDYMFPLLWPLTQKKL